MPGREPPRGASPPETWKNEMNRLLDNYLRSFRGLDREAWLLSLVVFINGCGSMVVFFLTLYLTRELGYSNAAAGNMLSLYGLGSMIGCYAGGKLSDRWGSRRVQLASLLTAGFSYILLGYARGAASVAGMVFTLAVLANAFRPANVAAFSEIGTDASRARGFSLMRLAANLGVTVGPAAGGFLATIDYMYLFWVDGLTSIAAGAVLFLLYKGRQRSARTAVKRHESPLKDLIFMRFLGLLLIVGILFFQIFSTWPLYLKQECSMQENRIGLLLTVNAVMIVLFEMPLIHRVEKREPRRVMAFGTVFLALGLGLLGLGSGIGLILISVVLWTIGEMLIFPMSATYAAGRAAGSSSGAYMGLFTLTFSLANMASPPLALWAYDQWGSHRLWLFSGALGLSIGSGFWGFGRIRRDAVAAETA